MINTDDSRQPANTQASETANYSGIAYALLGGRKLLNGTVRNSLDAHDLISDGLPAAALLHLAGEAPDLLRGTSFKEATGISIRSLRRRKSDANRTSVSREHGDRAWCLASVLAQAAEALGSLETAGAWLLEPAIGLGNRRPVDLLASSAGVRAIRHHLTRVEYGVYC